MWITRRNPLGFHGLEPSGLYWPVAKERLLHHGVVMLDVIELGAEVATPPSPILKPKDE